MCIHIHTSCGTSKLQYCDCSESQLCLPCIFPLRLKGVFTYNFLDCTFLSYDFFSFYCFPEEVKCWFLSSHSLRMKDMHEFMLYILHLSSETSPDMQWELAFCFSSLYNISQLTKQNVMTYLKISMPGLCCEISGAIIFLLHRWVVFPYRGLGYIGLWPSLFSSLPKELAHSLHVLSASFSSCDTCYPNSQRHTWNWTSPCSLLAL